MVSPPVGHRFGVLPIESANFIYSAVVGVSRDRLTLPERTAPSAAARRCCSAAPLAPRVCRRRREVRGESTVPYYITNNLNRD